MEEGTWAYLLLTSRVTLGTSSSLGRPLREMGMNLLIQQLSGCLLCTTLGAGASAINRTKISLPAWIYLPTGRRDGERNQERVTSQGIQMRQEMGKAKWRVEGSAILSEVVTVAS